MSSDSSLLLDGRLDQFNAIIRGFAMPRDLFDLLDGIEAVNDFSEYCVFAVQMRRGSKHDEKRCVRRVRIAGPRHR